MIFICLYDKNKDKHIEFDMFVNRDDRRNGKKEVLEAIFCKLLEYLENV